LNIDKKESRQSPTTTASEQIGGHGTRTSAQRSGNTRRGRTSGADSGAVAKNPGKPRRFTESTADPDLDAVIAAWPNLPPAIRAGVLALIRATGGGNA
jgi:hypothetical protein